MEIATGMGQPYAPVEVPSPQELIEVPASCVVEAEATLFMNG